MHYVSLCTLKSLIRQAVNTPRPATPHFPFSCLWREDSSLQKRMFCGKSQPSKDRLQHSERSAFTDGGLLGSNTSNQESNTCRDSCGLPFPHLEEKFGDRRKDCSALRVVFFLSFFSSLGKKSSYSYKNTHSCQKSPK